MDCEGEGEGGERPEWDEGTPRAMLPRGWEESEGEGDDEAEGDEEEKWVNWEVCCCHGLENAAAGLGWWEGRARLGCGGCCGGGMAEGKGFGIGLGFGFGLGLGIAVEDGGVGVVCCWICGCGGGSAAGEGGGALGVGGGGCCWSIRRQRMKGLKRKFSWFVNCIRALLFLWTFKT